MLVGDHVTPVCAQIESNATSDHMQCALLEPPKPSSKESSSQHTKPSAALTNKFQLRLLELQMLKLKQCTPSMNWCYKTPASNPNQFLHPTISASSMTPRMLEPKMGPGFPQFVTYTEIWMWLHVQWCRKNKITAYIYPLQPNVLNKRSWVNAYKHTLVT